MSICGFDDKECAICGAGGGCLAGRNDDDFFPATKEKLIKRLDNGEYKNYRDLMIRTLKEKYNYEYVDKS